MLFVDDEENVLIGLKRLLRGKYELVTAHTPFEALALMETNEFEVIVSDMRMPGLTGTDFLDTAISESRAKHVSPAELQPQLERLKAGWSEIRARLQAQLLPSAEMQRRLHLVGAPTEPEQIGITRDRLRDGFFRAYHIRRRFTVLDVAVRTGTLDSLLAGLFGPGAVWSLPTGATPANKIPA